MNDGTLTTGEILWSFCMSQARQCDTFVALLEKGMEANSEYLEPLPAEEALKVIASAWGCDVEGRSRAAENGRLVITREEVLAFPGCHALRLWLLLKASHGTRKRGPFAISQNEVAALLGVREPKMPGLIRGLIEAGQLRRVHQGKGQGDKYVLAEN